MALTKYKLGELIELTTETNSNNLFNSQDVKGVTITKQFIPTKADVDGTDLKKFLVIHPKDFVFNPRTHGKHIGFGYNSTNKSFITSWNNVGFRVKERKKELILDEYLFLHFNRDEWDRKACYCSWGSSTEVFSWEALCDMFIELPDLAVQQKYVDIYNAMVANQQSYERGLDDLKLVCDGFIEDLRKKYELQKLRGFIIKTGEKNIDNKIKKVKNVSVYKTFNEPTAKVNRNELSGYKIVRPNEISFVQTTHNEKVFAFAINNTEDSVVVTPVNEVFRTIDSLYPYYLSLFFMRKEFDRYARFHSWGSARETFVWEDLCEVKIPIPPIEIQKSIANVFIAYQNRKAINEKMKAQIKSICPILIRGSLEEGREIK